MQLILASTSIYRGEILSKLQLPFRQLPSHIEELVIAGESPQDRALRLSREKALAVAAQCEAQALVIGSDQVAHLNGRLLHKPGNFETAREQLQRVSGQSVSFETGCCVVDSASRRMESRLDTVTVTFRDLAITEIEHYLHLEQPYDCAGSFKAEGLGICLFEKIQSKDPNALIGLGLISLCEILNQFGVNPLALASKSDLSKL